jgi:hypothetical protein
MSADNQLEFESLAFPKDRKMLRVAEIAAKLDCTEEHIHNLIDEGQIGGYDISGRNNLTDRSCRRVPVEAWEKFLKERRI